MSDRKVLYQRFMKGGKKVSIKERKVPFRKRGTGVLNTDNFTLEILKISC